MFVTSRDRAVPGTVHDVVESCSLYFAPGPGRADSRDAHARGSSCPGSPGCAGCPTARRAGPGPSWAPPPARTRSRTPPSPSRCWSPPRCRRRPLGWSCRRRARGRRRPQRRRAGGRRAGRRASARRRPSPSPRGAGREMAAACALTPTGMTAVLGGDPDEVLAGIEAPGSPRPIATAPARSSPPARWSAGRAGRAPAGGRGCARCRGRRLPHPLHGARPRTRSARSPRHRPRRPARCMLLSNADGTAVSQRRRADRPAGPPGHRAGALGPLPCHHAPIWG